MSGTTPIGTDVVPMATYRILDSVREHHAYDVDYLGRRLARALSEFPALKGTTVTVARDNPGEDRKGGAWPWSRIVFIPDNRPVSNVTLYHELGHLAIQERIDNGEDHPRTSEEYCSIFAMARMPPGVVDEERVPYLGEPTVAPAEYPAVCQRALEYREENHDYIQQCKRWLGVLDDD